MSLRAGSYPSFRDTLDLSQSDSDVVTGTMQQIADSPVNQCVRINSQLGGQRDQPPAFDKPKCQQGLFTPPGPNNKEHTASIELQRLRSEQQQLQGAQR